MRTGRPGKVKWTAEQEAMIRELYPIIGPKELAKQMGVDHDCLMNRASYLGVRTPVSFQWTEEMLTVLKTRYTSDGPSLLSKELKVPYWTLLSKARRMGLKPTRKTPPKDFEWTEEMLTALRERYAKEGGSELAKEIGVTIDTVRRKAGEIELHTIAGHAVWGSKRAELSTSCDIHYFKKWTPEMAYILGFLFADGNIDKSGRMIRINLVEDDNAILYFIKSELKANYPIRYIRPRVCKKGGNPCRPQSNLTICSKVIADSLMKLGMKPRKTYNDDPYPSIPDALLPHFARGNLDGDGCVYVGNSSYCRVSFLGSRKFVVGLRDALVRLIGITCKSIESRQGKEAELCNVYWSKKSDLIALRDFLYPPNHGFCFVRKRDKLVNWLSDRV